MMIDDVKKAQLSGFRIDFKQEAPVEVAMRVSTSVGKN